jgi:hypothetical protein
MEQMKDYKIVHFSYDFSMEDINEAMSFQDEIIYYTREITEKKEFHIVNHKGGKFPLTPFVTQLFNFYSKDANASKFIGESKVKGNNNFSIIVNANDKLINQLKKDLNVLLKK